MSFIANIILFLKKIFRKEKNTLLLDNQEYNLQENKKLNFRKEIKVEQKNRVETLKCTGDGLGIQNKIGY